MLQTLKNRRAEGFTLVELLIVIVVIAILAAIVITTFSGVQAKARDTERQTDMKSVASQLEAYHASEGTYPATAQIVGPATPAAVTGLLKGLSPDALKNPQNNAANAFTSSAATTTTYQYVATPTSPACAGTPASPCTGFTITYVKEEDSETVTIEDLN